MVFGILYALAVCFCNVFYFEDMLKRYYSCLRELGITEDVTLILSLARYSGDAASKNCRRVHIRFTCVIMLRIDPSFYGGRNI